MEENKCVGCGAEGVELTEGKCATCAAAPVEGGEVAEAPVVEGGDAPAEAAAE